MIQYNNNNDYECNCCEAKAIRTVKVTNDDDGDAVWLCQQCLSNAVGLFPDGKKCDPDKCPDACDKDPSEENPVVRHDDREIESVGFKSTEDERKVWFAEHIIGLLNRHKPKVKSDLVFFFNAVNTAKITLDAHNDALSKK